MDAIVATVTAIWKQFSGYSW